MKEPQIAEEWPVISSENEYQQMVAPLAVQREQIIQYATDWTGQGFTPEQVTKLREPLEPFDMHFRATRMGRRF